MRIIPIVVFFVFFSQTGLGQDIESLCHRSLPYYFTIYHYEYQYLINSADSCYLGNDRLVVHRDALDKYIKKVNYVDSYLMKVHSDSLYLVKLAAPDGLELVSLFGTYSRSSLVGIEILLVRNKYMDPGDYVGITVFAFQNNGAMIYGNFISDEVLEVTELTGVSYNKDLDLLFCSKRTVYRYDLINKSGPALIGVNITEKFYGKWVQNSIGQDIFMEVSR